ncbi:MAG: sigma-70 family RNA polymerase sigma factor, partial [Nocardioidaceae bacterium]
MTELLSHVETPSDAELISRVRGGDVAAYGGLFARHRAAALRLARQLVRGPDADDLVSDAFAKVLGALQGGGGPDVAFRAYLLTSVRRLHVDKIRASSKLQTTDDLTPFDPGVPFQDTAVAGFESSAAAKAFASLPERWQLVLWHLEIEGNKPADIAPLLGMSANSVSALAYRAREGLRQAFLTMHLSDISEADCRWTTEHLGAFVRKGLSKRDATKLQDHLDECRRCMAMYLELTDVNSNLAAIIGPLLLGAAASGYLASSGGAGTAGLLTLLGRARDGIAANVGAATAGGLAAGVAAAAVAGFVILHHSPSTTQVSTADKPLTASSAPAVPGGSPSSDGSAGSHPSNSSSRGASPGASTDASGGPSAPTSTTPGTTTTVPPTTGAVPAAALVSPAPGTGTTTGGQPGSQSGQQ